MIETTTVLTLWVHISCVPITYPWQTLNVPEPHALLHMGGGRYATRRTRCIARCLTVTSVLRCSDDLRSIGLHTVNMLYVT